MEATSGVSSADQRAARVKGYESERSDVLAHVPMTAQRILELGCSTGALGEAIKRRQPAHVVGVELDPAYAAVAGDRLDRVVVSDASAYVAERPPEAPFDCLICADVLEHLVDPWSVFSAAASWLRTGGTAVVSLPNVLYYGALYHVLRSGTWPRVDEGIHDRTHLRWFTLRDATSLVEGAGLEVENIELRLWAEGGRREPVVRALQRTPLKPFVAGQHIVVGRRP